MSRRKQRSAFDLVSEFDRGRIVAYRDWELTYREIGSHVGRNQTTVMRISDRWIQEGTTNRRGRSHPPQCTTSTECSVHKMSIAWSTLVGEPLTSPPPMHDDQIRVWRRRGKRMLNSCVMHRHTGSAPGIMVWGGIGYHSRTPLLRIAGTLNSQRYISEITPPAITPDQLSQRVEAVWSVVAQEHIQSLFESMPRRVTAVIPNNGGYSGY
ncbi:transposable element Tcb1 transposase [Trichonephila clavipes]|nr:transposable element Tcb1 transposase [Trichonephila clavipes]